MSQWVWIQFGFHEQSRGAPETTERIVRVWEGMGVMIGREWKATEAKLLSILSESKISIEALQLFDADDYVACPTDPSHRVCRRFYEEHMVVLKSLYHS